MMKIVLKINNVDVLELKFAVRIKSLVEFHLVNQSGLLSILLLLRFLISNAALAELTRHRKIPRSDILITLDNFWANK